MSKIAIINSSVRPNGIGSHVAAWIKPILEEAAPVVTFTIINLSSFDLPVFDESAIPAMVPAMAQWTKPYSKAWSDEISKYDAYVLLGNEYNFGMSGATKNAIDFLYHAWIGKPILIVTYGIMGGGNASDQLKTVLTGMKTKPVETRPQLGFFGAQTGQDMGAAFGGVLGEASKQEWEKEKKPEILKGLEEVKAILSEPKPAEGH